MNEYFLTRLKKKAPGLSSNSVNRSSIPIYNMAFETVDMSIPKMASIHEPFKMKAVIFC